VQNGAVFYIRVKSQLIFANTVSIGFKHIIEMFRFASICERLLLFQLPDSAKTSKVLRFIFPITKSRESFGVTSSLPRMLCSLICRNLIVCKEVSRICFKRFETDPACLFNKWVHWNIANLLAIGLGWLEYTPRFHRSPFHFGQYAHRMTFETACRSVCVSYRRAWSAIYRYKRYL